MLVGFLLAYPYSAIAGTDAFNTEARTKFLPEWFDESIVLIKQIGVDREKSRQGIARLLYEHLFGEMPVNSCVFGAIVEDPPNPASEAFHRELSCSRLGSLPNSDGRARGIWFRKVK